MTNRQAQWAGVEFQPDLKDPKPPIRLGLVLHAAKTTGENSIVVLGRMPRVQARPQGFERASDMTMELACRWVDVMGKDVLDGFTGDVLQYLAGKWRWNLYIIEPKIIRLSGSINLLTRAQQLYKAFVGEPFEAPKPRKVRARPSTAPLRPTPTHVPPAWMLDEILRRRLAVHANH